MKNKILKIIKSLVSVKKLDELMETVLMLTRNVVNCDAGSIFIYNREDESLVFKYTQNESVNIPFKEFSVSLDETSIAGYTGISKNIIKIDDVYKLSNSLPYKFNKDFDTMSGYFTKSLISIPLINAKSELTGVLQLINKKICSEKVKPHCDDNIVIPFNYEDLNVLYSLSGIIGVALENSLLYDEIELMWEGFITASIQAIEARDPVTKGHTDRVTKLTMKIADALDKDEDDFPDFKMDKNGFKLLKYSCLLHDFGKIGVREFVLNKSEKLGKKDIEFLKVKFEIAIKDAMISMNEKKVAFLKNCMEKVMNINHLSFYDDEILSNIEKCKDVWIPLHDGERVQLVNENEFQAICIKSGTLTEDERKEIQSHVRYTFDYLNKIPWNSDLKSIPQIACMHHEKIDGSGYPFGLKGDEIHIFGRIMALADIFDALTSKDRPYKESVPLEQALDIIRNDALNQKLDKKIVDFFIEKRLYMES